jgi:hypothetical protein
LLVGLVVGQFGRPHTAAPTRLHILCFGPSFCIRPRFRPYVVDSAKGDRDPLFHPTCADDHVPRTPGEDGRDGGI